MKRAAVSVLFVVASACASSTAKQSTTYTTTKTQHATTCQQWPSASAADRTAITSALLDKNDVDVTIAGSGAFQTDIDDLCAKLPHSKVDSTEVATYLIRLHGSRYR